MNCIPAEGGDMHPVFEKLQKYLESVMEITFNPLGDIRIMKVIGSVSVNNLGEFKKAMDDLTDGNTKSVVVDLQDVPFLDSAAISVLISGKKKMVQYNGSFGLVNVCDNLMLILVMCSLDKFFTIYERYDDFVSQ